ncbi:MAG: site-specific integrase [Rhodospirillales bacterium]|nr:site-specific integrase [Rhodospirillales bacterium]
MRLPAYVYRRGTRYWFRRTVPAPLLFVFFRAELRCSLRTNMPAEASGRARRLAVVLDAVFAIVGEAMQAGTTLSRDTLDVLVRELMSHELERAERARACAGPRSDSAAAAAAAAERAQAEALTAALRRNDLAPIAAPLAGALARLGIAVAADSPDWRIAGREALRAQRRVHLANAERELGFYGEDDGPGGPPPAPARILPRAASSPAAEPAITPPATPAAQPAATAVPATDGTITAETLLSVAWPVFVAAKREADWKAKEQERDADKALRAFRDFVGDKPLAAITAIDAARMRSQLLRVPKLNGKGLYAGLTLAEAIAKAEALEAEQLAAVAASRAAGRLLGEDHDRARQAARVERLSLTTVNRYLSPLSTLFAWLDQERHLKLPSPFAGIPFSKRVRAKRARDQRQSFTDGELRRLFATPLWTGCASPHRRWQPGALVVKDARYWIPLLMAFASLRLEEASQLFCDDVATLDGIACLIVRGDNALRTTKSDSSARIVPVHSTLIRLGFLEHVERMRADGRTRVFPHLERDARGRLGGAVSKWFTEYRRRIGAYEKHKDAHSLRHFFDTHLHDRDVPTVRVAELMGHASPGETAGRYYKGAKLQRLREAIERLDFGLLFEERDGAWHIAREQPPDDADSRERPAHCLIERPM